MSVVVIQCHAECGSGVARDNQRECATYARKARMLSGHRGETNRPPGQQPPRRLLFACSVESLRGQRRERIAMVARPHADNRTGIRGRTIARRGEGSFETQVRHVRCHVVVCAAKRRGQAVPVVRVVVKCVCKVNVVVGV